MDARFDRQASSTPRLAYKTNTSVFCMGVDFPHVRCVLRVACVQPTGSKIVTRAKHVVNLCVYRGKHACTVYLSRDLYCKYSITLEHEAQSALRFQIHPFDHHVCAHSPIVLTNPERSKSASVICPPGNDTDYIKKK